MSSRRARLAVASWLFALLAFCAPVSGSRPVEPTTYTPTTCFATSGDSLCARESEVVYGLDERAPVSVAPRSPATPLVGSSFVEARGIGSFDLVLGKQAVCYGYTAGQQPTSLWTRIPADALLTLKNGRAICTMTGGRTIKLGGSKTLNPDGTVTVRDVIGEVTSGLQTKAQFVLEVNSTTGRTTIHAASVLKYVRANGSEFAIQGNEVLLFPDRGTSFEKFPRALTAYDTSVLNKQSEVVQ